MTYDPNNIFAKILRGELPCKKVFENEYALAIHDINPKTPVHVLVIPKGEYKDQTDFTSHASEAEIVGFVRALGEAAKCAGIAEDGYRAISNCGRNGAPEVPHYHVHLLGGGRVGRMVCPD